nr:hypothetical protein [Tanacetum cinerariifolium]
MVKGMEEERMGVGSREGPNIPAPLAQTNTCQTVIKENIKASRTLTGEHDQHENIWENPKKLTCNESKREELEDPQYAKQPYEKSLISKIRESELLGNFYMEIPKQKFRSSYGSMPLKGVRKISSGIPLEIKKNQCKTHSILKMDVANLALAELDKCSGEADTSKDMTGPESPDELWKSWYVKGQTRSGFISPVRAQHYQETVLGFEGSNLRTRQP